jgi:hypothetical protein
LKSAPEGDVKIRIEDAQGQLIRTLTGTKTPGINRVNWDLRGEQTKEVRVRTSPAFAPEVRVGPEGWRLAPDGARMSVLMPPGTYTVKLVLPGAAGQMVGQQLIVKKDPNSEGTEADINAQVAMLFELRKDLENAADMVNQIEVIRSQLTSMITLLDPGNSGTGTVSSSDYVAIKKAAADVDKKLLDIIATLIQRRLTNQGQDSVRWPPKLISKINYLANGLASGDFPPTTQQREVHAMFRAQLTTLRQQLDDVLNKDLDSFNKLLREKNVQNVIPRAAQ